ncbi:hypothetical protein BHC43_02105 [Snodgrassella alvi]|nr:hypothetical protein BHC43_02105 [Snodgrassella alvi]
MLGYSAGFIKSDTSATLNYFLYVERHGDSMPFVNFFAAINDKQGYSRILFNGAGWWFLVCAVLNDIGCCFLSGMSCRSRK